MNPSRGSRAKLIAGGLVALIPPALVVLAWLFPAIDSQFIGIATGASIFACAIIAGFLTGFALGRAPDGQIAIGFLTAGLLVLLYFLCLYLMVSLSGRDSGRTGQESRYRLPPPWRQPQRHSHTAPSPGNA